MSLSRRRFLVASAAALGAGVLAPWKLNPSHLPNGLSAQRALLAGGATCSPQAAVIGYNRAAAAALGVNLLDPATQPKFAMQAPNALAPSFKVDLDGPRRRRRTSIAVYQTQQQLGLVGANGAPLTTTVWGYGNDARTASWPGRTIEIDRGIQLRVRWENELKDAQGGMLPHLLPVDNSFHWAYSLPGYEQHSIAADGVPIVPHVHGAHVDWQSDGNPEYFFSPDWKVRGPRWLQRIYRYDNDQPAGTLWYHDHCLGITRLNVYAGLAGFYIVRDEQDTGTRFNPLRLPAFPYELAYAIQDRMFSDTGALFYPAFPGDPAWAEFITDMGLADNAVPQPSGLAEFFGDHMVVNGVIWPKTAVEPRHYRMRLLNGCDSRFLNVHFRAVADGVNANATDLSAAGAPLPFYVIGSDQGLAAAATVTDALLIAPGERYDIVVDFSQVPLGTRVIMTNSSGDAPFGGFPLDEGAFYPDRQTDRIMAFDVTERLNRRIPDRFDPGRIACFEGNTNPVTNVRKVALFEGADEFGRLQPMLGVAGPVIDAAGAAADGSIPWHAPTTENPDLNATEIWEIYNTTGDAHPVHLHLVHFEILEREGFTADLIDQPVVQHHGAPASGYRIENILLAGNAVPAAGSEKAPKDMVTAYPGEVTRIKVTFDKPGRYVWHCHILSHEDHDMMRVLHVGPGAEPGVTAAAAVDPINDIFDMVDEEIFLPFVGR